MSTSLDIDCQERAGRLPPPGPCEEVPDLTQGIRKVILKRILLRKGSTQTSKTQYAIMDDYLTPRQAAERKGVPTATIYKAIARGTLPAVRLLSRLALPRGRRGDVPSRQLRRRDTDQQAARARPP